MHDEEREWRKCKRKQTMKNVCVGWPTQIHFKLGCVVTIFIRWPVCYHGWSLAGPQPCWPITMKRIAWNLTLSWIYHQSRVRSGSPLCTLALANLLGLAKLICLAVDWFDPWVSHLLRD